MAKSRQQYILKKDCPNIGKETGDYYNGEYGDNIEELIRKGIIEEELSPEEYEEREIVEAFDRLALKEGRDLNLFVHLREFDKPIPVTEIIRIKEKQVALSTINHNIWELEHQLQLWSDRNELWLMGLRFCLKKLKEYKNNLLGQ